MASKVGAVLRGVGFIVGLLAIGCGKCPDGTEPDDNCVCSDTEKTKLEPPKCTPKATEAPPTDGLANVVVRENYEAVGVRDDWSADGQLLTHDGKAAAHPPELKAGQDATVTFDCNGVEHSQFRFFFNQLAENATLDLSVDYQLRETFSGLTTDINASLNWREFVVDVPEGLHAYTFTVHALKDVAPAFLLDTLVCRRVAAEPSRVVDFDDGFVPPETTGDWVIDNTRLKHEGEAAIRPLALKAGQDATLDFNCGGEVHTQLKFALNQLAAAADLELQVDHEAREVFSNYTTDINASLNWRTFVIDVPRGPHVYSFIAHAKENVTPPFVLDTFTCGDVEPIAEPFGHIDFDDGFVPLEVTGDWVVDNTRLFNAGEAAVHPKALEAGETASMEFHCDAESQISFALNQLEAAATLELQVDLSDELTTYTGYTTDINASLNWRSFSLPVNSGAHVLKFKAIAQGKVSPPFVLDTFVCE